MTIQITSLVHPHHLIKHNSKKVRQMAKLKRKFKSSVSCTSDRKSWKNVIKGRLWFQATWDEFLTATITRTFASSKCTVQEAATAIRVPKRVRHVSTHGSKNPRFSFSCKQGGAVRPREPIRKEDSLETWHVSSLDPSMRLSGSPVYSHQLP